MNLHFISLLCVIIMVYCQCHYWFLLLCSVVRIHSVLGFSFIFSPQLQRLKCFVSWRMFCSRRHVAFNLPLSGLLVGNRVLLTWGYVSQLLIISVSNSQSVAQARKKIIIKNVIYRSRRWTNVCAISILKFFMH